MRIFIDADGSPVVNLAIDIAQDYNLDVIIVKNYAHQIKSDYAEVISVDVSSDSADYYIVNHLEKGDIVVTQDYGLAALCLSKETYPINQNGLIYTEDNISGVLDRRYIHAKLRNEGMRHTNAKKRKVEDDRNFKLSFIELIENLINN